MLAGVGVNPIGIGEPANRCEYALLLILQTVVQGAGTAASKLVMG
jgi:hypothetical protein